MGSQTGRAQGPASQEKPEAMTGQDSGPTTSDQLHERGVPMIPQSKVPQATTILITTDEIAKLPVKTPYLIDLTRQGVIYTCDSSARRIDFSRIMVRTAKGDVPLESWLNGHFKSPVVRGYNSSRLLSLGHSINFAGVRFRPPQTNFTCQGLECTCSGTPDCNDMFGSGVCGDIAACTENGCACLRL